MSPKTAADLRHSLSSPEQLPDMPLARPNGLPTRGVPVTTPPLDCLLTMARVAGSIDVDHPPAPSGLGEDPRSHCADDPELVDPAVERREGETLHGMTVLVACRFTSWRTFPGALRPDQPPGRYFVRTANRRCRGKRNDWKRHPRFLRCRLDSCSAARAPTGALWASPRIRSQTGRMRFHLRRPIAPESPG